MSAYIVGLTGGIGSGKTTVADLFAERGIAVVDTDRIAHELTAAAGAAMPGLIDRFGAAIATPDGALDRTAMRRIAFADPAARSALEGILHPLIRTQSATRCAAAASPYVVLAVPLLVETGAWQERCDRVLVIDCPETVQIARVMQRSGLSADEARAILAAQATRAQRLAVADDILSNDAGRDALQPQVAALHEKYLAQARQKPQANC